MDAENALKRFVLENNISSLPPTTESDNVFKYDKAEQQRIMNDRPWKRDPTFFTSTHISAIALVKMVMHARSTLGTEIMGLMQGKVDIYQSDSGIPKARFLILDSFALPVTGTETRVNAGNEANEYMVQFLESAKSVGRLENAIGWYHSHPGYGCWLSGIDVDTQKTNQMFQDPFVAVVIDPNRTISAGKVDIGAFRTYPEGYTPPNAAKDEYQSIPLSKIEDFGVHANAYYPLDISVFKSSLDEKILGLLWNKYWVSTLSQSSLITNRAYATSQIADLSAKLRQAETFVQSRGNMALPTTIAGGGDSGNGKGPEKTIALKEEKTVLGKVVKDASKIATEASHALMQQVLKDVLFNTRLTGLPLEELSQGDGGGAPTVPTSGPV
uniref:COP9 signalosome complex subunit 5 n=1 Tax=Bartheletia paradoxa TaxID=669517 RepID=A0A2D0XI77_9BASI|nr:hypothetical protein SPAR01397 [Bartheletia paradoxa]